MLKTIKALTITNYIFLGLIVLPIFFAFLFEQANLSILAYISLFLVFMTLNFSLVLPPFMVVFGVVTVVLLRISKEKNENYSKEKKENYLIANLIVSVAAIALIVIRNAL